MGVSREIRKLLRVRLFTHPEKGAAVIPSLFGETEKTFDKSLGTPPMYSLVVALDKLSSTCERTSLMTLSCSVNR
jgi:hypothetical protein